MIDISVTDLVKSFDLEKKIHRNHSKVPFEFPKKSA